MTEDAQPESAVTLPVAREPEDVAEQSREFWPFAGALRRSRAFMLFLFVNWFVLGVYVLRTPSRVVALIAFCLGLVTLIGALGQRRGLSLAKTAPLVVLSETGVRYRRYTASDYEEKRWEEISEIRRDGVHIEVVGPDGVAGILPSTVLGDEGRDALEGALRAALEARTNDDR